MKNRWSSFTISRGSTRLRILFVLSLTHHLASCYRFVIQPN
jgi:hypothetical protein